MNKRKCTECGKLKFISEFYKNKYVKSGLYSRCKKCVLESNSKRDKTKIGLTARMYAHQRGASRKRGYSYPNYNLTDLREWVFNQSNFHYLYDKWVESGYNKNKIPSIDRLDDYESYNFNNIRLITWEENKNKGHFCRKNGLNNKDCKAVLQFTLKGEFVSEYYSQHDAYRKTGIFQASISRVCLKEQKTAGGYIWKYKQN